MKHLRLKSVVLLTLLQTFSPSLLANDWWFDVEVLLYRQDQSLPALQEQFRQPATVDINHTVDLISPFLRPDISALRNSLPGCEQPAPQAQRFVSLLPDDPTLAPLLKQIEQLSLQAEQSATKTSSTARPQSDAQIVGKLATPGAQSSVSQTHGVNLNRWLRGDCVFAKEQRWLDDLLFADHTAENLITSVPAVIDQTEQRFKNQPYLLPAAQLALRDIARDLHRQRGIRPLLHLAWRQPVLFGREKAQQYRLFAGTNYAQSYDSLGYPLQQEAVPESSATLASQPPETDLIRQVELALAQPLSLTEQDIEASTQGIRTEQLWQLDGWFKLYLQYINRVPYLHIDSELLYRAEGPPGLMQTQTLAAESETEREVSQVSTDAAHHYQLYSLPFKQLRRVISTQIHYFDHPMFGMVVQIRRFHKPEPPTEQAETE